MGFRDDAEAARARADALERENQELRTKLAALEEREDSDAPTTPEEEPQGGAGRPSPLLLALALVLGVGSGVAALVGVGPLALIGLVVASLLASAWVISGLLLIVGPAEVLVLSGRRCRGPDGRWRGYRTVRGGRVLRIPLIETAEWLSLQTICLTPRVEGAYLRGGDAATVEGSATVRIVANEPKLSRAVERFLGRPRAQIAEVAEETLEGALRGVLATVEPDVLEQEPPLIAQMVIEESDDDLDRLGLAVDTLKLRRVEAGGESNDRKEG